MRLRHADGTTTPIWTYGKDTRTKKADDTELFQNVTVRAVMDYPAGQG